MAKNDKVILDVKIEYNVEKLKDKVQSAKNLQKKQASLNAQERAALEEELRQLEEDEAAGDLKTHRRNNLIFVTDEPNGNTRKKCPVAVAVPSSSFDAKGRRSTHSVRPPFNPDNKITFDSIRFPDHNEIPYMFTDRGGKLYPKVQLETAIEVYPYTPFDNGTFNWSIYPEFSIYYNTGDYATDCQHPARQVIQERKPVFAYFKGFDILLPVEGTTAIYIKYQRYWYSYLHSYVIQQNQVRPEAGCILEVPGTMKTIEQKGKKVDLWTGTTARAFLVGSENIKEIQLPSRVKDRLKKVTGEPAYRTRPQTMFKENDTKLTEAYDNYDNPAWIDSVYNGETDENYYPGLLWSYGFGVYDTTLHTDSRCFSPAIYAFLNEYDGQYQGQDLIQDYDSIKQLYDPKPTAFLTLEDTSVEPDPADLSSTTIVTKLLYTTTRPSNSTLPLEEDIDKIFIIRKCPNEIRIRYGEAGPSAEESPLYAWDWGQPAYCYSEARKLGFTAEDLRFE